MSIWLNNILLKYSKFILYSLPMITGSDSKILADIKSKEECKDQESIQSSTTPDTGHHMGN